MNVGKTLGRAMLAAMFIEGGYAAAKEPGGRVEMAETAGVPDAELMVKVNGVLMVVGGLMLALGFRPKVAALVLAGCLIPTTYAGHQFWGQESKQASDQQRTQFLKNVSMLGGLVHVLSDRGH